MFESIIKYVWMLFARTIVYDLFIWLDGLLMKLRNLVLKYFKRMFNNGKPVA